VAKEVFRDAEVILNSVTVSSLIETVEIQTNRNAERATGLSDEAEVEMPGLKNNAVSMTAYASFGTDEIFQTLRTLWEDGTVFTWSVKKTAGSSVAADNPQFSGSAFVKDWKPLGGDVGARHMSEITLGLTTDITIAVS
jgi:hypothetical protein